MKGMLNLKNTASCCTASQYSPRSCLLITDIEVTRVTPIIKIV